ncbi:hypothetical protein J5I95_00815 [Candidatus Poribacteria bacterium]|nr:hypothetical protein [Candidatus Poribacteria bacterium]
MKKLTLSIFLVVCLGGIWYFGHHRPTQETLKAAPKKIYKTTTPITPENSTVTGHSTEAIIHETMPAENVQNPVDSTPEVSMDNDTVEIVHTGPLKGLPLDLAKEIHKEYTDASIARAKRYDEWYQQQQAHRERDRALFEKEVALGDALSADSKKRREQILAVYTTMSPEQLEAARKEALKTQPAEYVELFFKHVSEFSTSKSPEQIAQEAQDGQRNNEKLWIKRDELHAEREQLNREWDELQRTKPLPPNLGLDEFYTEWKKRNSTKPTPP